jgi:hypothetical protein
MGLGRLSHRAVERREFQRSRVREPHESQGRNKGYCTVANVSGENGKSKSKLYRDLLEGNI